MRNVKWPAVVAALIFAAAVGAFAYNLGIAHGAEHPPAWHPHWGGPGFFFGPLFFILFWFVFARGLYWRGRCGRHEKDAVPR